jgi:hypothetical protein
MHAHSCTAKETQKCKFRIPQVMLVKRNVGPSNSQTLAQNIYSKKKKKRKEEEESIVEERGKSKTLCSCFMLLFV